MACNSVLSCLVLALYASAQHDAYIDPQPVNTSMCLAAVEELPLRIFGFKYDSKQGRRQVGVVGPELKQVMPDSVKIVRSQPFPNPLKTGPKVVKVKNYHHVDQNILFMHGLGATQELAKKHNRQAEALGELRNDTDKLMACDERRKREYTEHAGSLAAFGSDGELTGNSAIKLRNGTLEARRIGSFALAGDVRCDNRTLIDARLRGGRAEALDRLTTQGAAVIGDSLDVGGDTRVAGSLTALGMVSGAGPFHDLSDARLKRAVRAVPPAQAVAALRALRAVTFQWVNAPKREQEQPVQPHLQDQHFQEDREMEHGQIVGFIAQEVERAIPSAVRTRPDGFKAVATSRIVPHLVEGFKAVAKQLDETASSRSALEERLDRLEDENAALRKVLEQQRVMLARAMELMS